MNSQTDELRLYFTRVRPACRELFSMAYAMRGTYEGAEYALQKVILGGWQNRRRFRSTKGFRESLRADMRRVAMEGVGDESETTWDEWKSSTLRGEETDPLTETVCAESAETRRAVLLRYGCGLKNTQIARCMGISVKQADQLVSRLMRRLNRRAGNDKTKPEALLRRVCQEELEDGGVDLPDLGVIYRKFEAEAGVDDRPVARATSRALSVVAALVLVALLAGILWVIAAVIRPAQIEETQPSQEVLQEQIG